MPIAFTDDQMDIVQRLAAPLVVADRGRFLERVAELLRGHEIGDGSVARAARLAQSEFRRAVTLEVRQVYGGKYGR